MKDTFGFLNNVTNWNNHRPLLFKALEATQGPVLELGIGDGSTPFLHNYCEAEKRPLISVETDNEWLNKFKHLSTDMHALTWCAAAGITEVQTGISHYGVVFVDNAPGESRWELIKKFKNRAEIIVVHDSEPAATGYMLTKIFGLFKYRVDYPSDGAWATALSNTVDITKWVGSELKGLDEAGNEKIHTITKFHMRPNKTVILSSNDNPDYLKYYPYVAWAWNQLGWDTLLFYLGKHSVLLEQYKMAKPDFDEERNKIIALSNIEGYRQETVVQVSRLFGGLVYGDGRLLMTGDVDMIPLSDYWQPQDHEITCYGWDLTGYTQYPLCYIAMADHKWREVMNLPDKTTLDHEIKRMLDSSPNPRSEVFEKWWGFDQEYITHRLTGLTTTHIPRGKDDDGLLALGRADRYNWEGTKERGSIDAHMPRPFNQEAVNYILMKNFGKLPGWLDKK